MKAVTLVVIDGPQQGQQFVVSPGQISHAAEDEGQVRVYTLIDDGRYECGFYPGTLSEFKSEMNDGL